MDFSYNSALWQALILYLESKAVGLSEASKPIKFSYFSDIHTPNQSPQGAVFLNSIDLDPTGMLDPQTSLDISFSIRLIVSFTEESISNFLILADWQSWLAQKLNDLRANGLTGTYRQKALRAAFIGCDLNMVTISLNANQDNGFQGIISTKLSWEKD
ncbi:MAG: hypothetical protein LW728_21850 [Microcystis sp. 49638_E5]|jgi:hypothetical protein|uniref:hypothetical protein n=1 Tax=Microcystis sp. 49638_E5 TaxID=2904986 RepID=UPI0025849617|nr:hypothetical protein [Microcystis sp. 49638_E5]MCE2671785.1 hypothetical protein [Microcystis sp. 49638_E5]